MALREIDDGGNVKDVPSLPHLAEFNQAPCAS